MSPPEREGSLWRAVFCLLLPSHSIVFWSQTMLSPAASFETLQCEGPVSTQDSSCDTEEDLTSPREVDFQFKGYTFSEPFHLIVSYGEVFGGTDQRRPILSPIFQPCPFSLTAHSGGCPQEIGHGMG